MTGFDIKAALAATENRSKSDRVCKAQAVLDQIPEDTPDRQILVDLVTKSDEGSPYAAAVFGNLGLRISSDTIQSHRAKRCRCFV